MIESSDRAETCSHCSPFYYFKTYLISYLQHFYLSNRISSLKTFSDYQLRKFYPVIFIYLRRVDQIWLRLCSSSPVRAESVVSVSGRLSCRLHHDCLHSLLQHTLHGTGSRGWCGGGWWWAASVLIAECLARRHWCSGHSGAEWSCGVQCPTVSSTEWTLFIIQTH